MKVAFLGSILLGIGISLFWPCFLPCLPLLYPALGDRSASLATALKFAAVDTISPSSLQISPDYLLVVGTLQVQHCVSQCHVTLTLENVRGC